MTVDIANLRKLLAEAQALPWVESPVTGNALDDEGATALKIGNYQTAMWLAIAAVNALPELLDELDRKTAALQGILDAIDSHHPKFGAGPFTLTRSEIAAARAAQSGDA